MEHRRSAGHAGVNQQLDDQQPDRPADQRALGAVAQQEGDHPDQGVADEDVAEPDQIEMDQSEKEQPEHPSIVNQVRGISLGLGPLDHEQHARPEQEGEEAAHLAVDQDEADHPGRHVGVADRTQRDRVHVGLEGQGEADDIHRQYAHHRDSADDVQCRDSR